MTSLNTSSLRTTSDNSSSASADSTSLPSKEKGGKETTGLVGGVQGQMFTENAGQRSFQACLECRRSKLKCDGLQNPDFQCTRCKQKGKLCNWPTPIPPGIAQQQQQQQQQQQIPFQHQLQYGPPPQPSSSAIPFQSNPIQTSNVTGFIDHPSSSSSSHSSSGNNRQKRQRIHGATDHRRNTNTSIHSNAIPFDTLRSVALLSPEEALSHHQTHTSPTILSTREASREHHIPSSNENEIIEGGGEQDDVNRGDGNESEDDAQGDDEDDGEDEGEEEDQDGQNINTSGMGEQKRSVDEQINALQERMGWTQERLREASIERRKFFSDAIAPEPTELDNHDPLKSGILKVEDIERLFKLFYETINVQHCLLDENYDSWKNVQKSSRSLFITICAISANLDDNHATSRHCSPMLLRSMEYCTSSLISSNAKSTEVVKTFLLAFLFMSKPPFAREDRCWTLIDTAGRIASELGIGKRLRTIRSTIDEKVWSIRPEDEASERQKRNAERAWATAVLLQRSLGSLHGMVSVINLDVHWDELDKWAEDSLAIPGDVQHCAYLNLRRIEFYTRSQLQRMEQHRFLSLESIRVSFNTLFESWQKRYVQHPKLAGHYACKSILMVVGLHIQLLINVTVLHTSKMSNKPENPHATMYMVPEQLEDDCAKMSINFCQFFIDNFQYRAHQLGRNIVSMVTWSVMIMLQLRYRSKRLLATRVAVLLAGTGTDTLHARSFARFTGRWLLSLINDLAQTSNERKATALLRHNRQYQLNYRPPQEFRRTGQQDRRSMPATVGEGESTFVLPQEQQAQQQFTPVRSENLNFPPWTIESEQTQPTSNVPMFQENFDLTNKNAIADSTENILSSMSGHMTTDPFNEVWLNSFLDSLVPPPITPSNDPSGRSSTTNTINQVENPTEFTTTTGSFGQNAPTTTTTTSLGNLQ